MSSPSSSAAPDQFNAVSNSLQAAAARVGSFDQAAALGALPLAAARLEPPQVIVLGKRRKPRGMSLRQLERVGLAPMPTMPPPRPATADKVVGTGGNPFR